MKYDFTTVIERKGKDALAVDGLGLMKGFAPDPPKEGYDIIPMWVADMNFATAPAIIDAMKARLEHPLFGYYMTREEYYDSIIRWHKVRNHVDGLTKAEIGYENGVLGGVISALRAIIDPGANVLLHCPTYIGFTNSLTTAGYNIVHSDLKQDEDGNWAMDYEDMDRKIKENDIKVCIFCHPHNPAGRVWTKDEMLKALDVYAANDCIVIVDEIWSDLIMNHNEFVPFETISEEAKKRTIAFYAPSKTFNLAGLIGSYHIIYNPELRKRVEESAAKTHYNEMNIMSMYALIGAYSDDGMAWTDELLEVLSENVNYACDFINNNLPGIKVTKPQGTYMLFLDCEEWCEKNEKTMDDLLKLGWDVGVAWQDGRPFHGTCAIRMNLAVPTERVKEACRRLKCQIVADKE